MKTVIWELRYDREVTSFLYSLRSTEAGPKIHAAIKELQFAENPAEDTMPIKDRPGSYEFESNGYWVGIDIVEEKQKIVRVLYIKTP